MEVEWKNTNSEKEKIYRKIFENKYRFKLREDRYEREFVIRNLESASEGKYSIIENPVWVGVKLTNRCNLQCKHCWAIAKDYAPTLEEIKIMIDKLYKAHVKFIGFSGGELFSRKDVLEILSYAKTYNLIVEIFTNGTLLTPQILNSLEKILDRKVDVIQISLDGISEDAINAQRGLKNSDKILVAIDELVKRKFVVRISYVVTSTNLYDLVPTFSLMEKVGVKGFSVSAVYPLNKGVIEYRKLDMEKYYEELYKIICTQHTMEVQYFLQVDFFERVSKYIEKLTMTPRRTSDFESGYVSWFIDADGNVYPEFQLEYEELLGGNIYQDSINDIVKNFSSMKLLANGRSLDKTECSKCMFKQICLNHSYDQSFEKYKEFNKKNPYCKMR